MHLPGTTTGDGLIIFCLALTSRKMVKDLIYDCCDDDESYTIIIFNCCNDDGKITA